MNFLNKLFAPKTANSKVNALLGFMNLGSLTSIGQAAKEKVARFTALANGKISREEAKVAAKELKVQAALARLDAQVASSAAIKAEAQARLANLNALLKVTEEILKAEIG